MKIQIISSTKNIKCTDCDIMYSKYSEPKTLDSFDVNIIDLQDEKIWKNDSDDPNNINIGCDLISIQKNIESSKKAINIIAFPQNYGFNYHYYSIAGGPNRYHKFFYLKNRINCLKEVLKSIIPKAKEKGTPSANYEIDYENSKTICGKSSFSAAFYFSKFIPDMVKTRAIDSDKATTILVTRNCYLTTLLLANNDCNLMDYLSFLGIKEKIQSDLPDWLCELNFFDDEEQRNNINVKTEEISRIEREIEQGKKKLNENLKYKSILYTNGKELVRVVFDILEKLLDCDLSAFKDEMKEDFLIKLNDITYIGEIKGVTSNVKSEHVSQIDVHYQSYLEKIAEEGQQENVKSLLIINQQRNKPLAEREEIHEKQIKLAKRNGCLIIPTIDLLKLFDKFVSKEINSENVIEIFTKQIGLITISKVIG